MKIPLSKIDVEQSVQVRAAIHGETVDRYAEHLQTPRAIPLPPIVVFGPDSRGMYFLSEGWHRYEAHKKAKRDGILATVKDGGWKEALEHALGSNAAHGLPRSNKDKRRVVELALMHWPTWSDQLIADKCAVHFNTVRSIRAERQPPQIVGVDKNPTTQNEELTETAPPTREVLGKDGKVRNIPTRPPVSKPPSVSPKAPPPAPSRNAPTVGKPEPAMFQPLDTSAKADALPVDELGKTVLPHLVSLWLGRDILRGMAAAIREVRGDVEQAQEDRSPLFCGKGQGCYPIDGQGIVAALKRAEEELKAGIPYTVCGICNGTGCRGCSGNGMVTEIQFSRLAPEFRR
jgi:uncharacterized ParB-like nuclease family protein